MDVKTERNLYWMVSRTAIAAASFFFLMTSYYVLKPTRLPLINTHIGREYVHYFYAANALVSLLGIVLYNHLVSRFPRSVLLRIVLLGIVAAFVALWCLFLPNMPIFTGMAKVTAVLNFFLVSTYILFCTSLFWSINHDLHTPGEAEKFYPYVNFGGQVGVITGAFLTSALAKQQLQVLIPVSLAGLLLCWAFLEWLKLYDPKLDENRYATPKPTGTVQDVKMFFSSSYVFFLGLIVIFATFVPTLADFQFNWSLDSTLLDDPELVKDDFRDVHALADKVVKADDPLAQYLRRNLAEDTRKSIAEGEKAPRDELGSAMAKDLNSLLGQPELLRHVASFPRLQQMVKETDELPRANRLLLEEAYGEINPYLLRESDVKNMSGFLLKLQKARPMDFGGSLEEMGNFLGSGFDGGTARIGEERRRQSGVSRFLYERLSPESRGLLREYDPSNKPPAALQEKVLRDVNLILQTGPLYSQEIFGEIGIKKVRRLQMRQNIEGTEAMVLNRAILEEVYGGEINSSQQTLQTRFKSNIHYYMGYVSILMCLVITPLLFKFLGPSLSICIYPLVLFALGVLFVREAPLIILGAFAMLAMTMNYTLYNVGKEAFFVPTDKNIKYKIKAFCETFVFRAGDALSSLVLAVYLAFISDSWAFGLSYITFAVVVLWIPVILKTGKQYRDLCARGGKVL